MAHRPYYLLGALLLLALFSPAQAHNGAVAIAVPVAGIEVDRDLSDWPEGMTRYPIALAEDGDRPKSDEDFQGDFRIGYNAQENALYVGVEIQDESVVKDEQLYFYLEPSHRGEDIQPINSARWADTLKAVEREVQWGEKGYRWEWRVDLERMGKGQIHLHPEMTLGFDVYLWDKDGDGSGSSMAWGRGTEKYLHSDELGDLVLVGEDEKAGRLQGRISWKGLEEGIARAKVRVQSLSAAALWVQVVSDQLGIYALELPAGRYRVEPGFGRGEKEGVIVEVGGGSKNEVTLSVELPKGLVIEARPGKAVKAGPGKMMKTAVGLQQGRWQAFSASQGLPSLSISAILQDRQGYLWFGTWDGGVSRYDGEQFKTFTTREGLASNRVCSITEDRAGNLWFGTDGGVSRYDGKQFQTFTAQDGLGDNWVFSILEDRTGNLWFGTDGGVSRYDGKQFQTFTTQEGLGESLVSNKVSSILEDQAGNLWFGTMAGVSRYDGQRFVTFTTKDGLADNRVNSLFEDRAGILWLGTEGGVSQYDGERFINFTAKDGLAHNSVTSIVEDRAGNLWFGTWDGASRYNGRTFTTFTAPGSSRSFVFDDIAKLTDRDVQGLLREVDQKDLVIALKRTHEELKQKFLGNMSTRVAGFIQQEVEALGPVPLSEVEQVQLFITRQLLQLEQEGHVTLPRKNTGERPAHNKITAMLEDHEGSLWFGTLDNGISRYEGEGLITFDWSEGGWAPSILKDREGNMWFGTWGEGVSRYDGQKFTTFTTQDGLAGDWVYSILEDREGNMWFSVEEWRTGGASVIGVSRYDGEQFTTFTGVWARALLEDRAGKLWFGMSEGVIQYDGEKFTAFTVEDGLADNDVSSILEDRRGNLWVGTQRRGVSRYDGKKFTTFTAEDGLADDRVNSLLTDRAGHLWLGTERGVSRYDGERFTTFTTAEGLADNAVSSILEGQDGHLWFGTKGGGVSLYDGLVFQHLTKQDGLPRNGIAGIAPGQDNTVWIHTGVELARYQPGHILPPIHLLKVVADRSYGPAAEIPLPSPQSSLAFEYQGISFKTRPGQMVYVYRLEGYDKDWRQTRESRVEYTNLPVGKYTFQVKAVDRDLNYSETPAQVRVTIHPPYGQIALMGGLGAALVGLVVAAGYGVRRRRGQRRAEQALLQEQQARLQAQEALNRELEEELQTAHEMQMALMPSESPRVAGLEITGRCLPANHVGGDLFQYFYRNEKLFVSLADVTGHAMAAAIPVVMFSGILKSQMEMGGTVEELFDRLNRSLYGTLTGRTFVCFVLGELNTATRVFRYSDAGCPYPYHYRTTTGKVTELRVDAYPLGIRMDTDYRAFEVQLEPGDRVVFCSDGIIEATNEAGEMFGFERAAETIRRGCAEDLSAEALLERIIQEVKAFSGEVPQGDDQTVVVLRVEPR